MSSPDWQRSKHRKVARVLKRGVPTFNRPNNSSGKSPTFIVLCSVLQFATRAQIVDEVAWAKNRTKSKVRAKVEHVFQVMKLKFGFVKVRYRGLKKNAHRLFVTYALVNLFVSRRKLLAVA